MGICVSFNLEDSNSSPTVKIVTVNGDLREYSVPVLGSQVLEAESSSSLTNPSSYFICNSDSLNYDDFIPEIEAEESLQADQLYFVLPISKRKKRLTATDMAALAVKASVAIKNSGGKQSLRRRKKVRMPLVMMLTGSNDSTNEKVSQLTVKKGRPLVSKTTSFKASTGYNRSGSVRNLRRLTSKRAKLAVRSFRLKLSTIYEGSVV